MAGAPPQSLAISSTAVPSTVPGTRSLDVMNPYTGEVVGTVPRATVDDVRRAFSIARAYKPRLTRYERSEICRSAAAIIASRAEPLG